MAKKLDPTYPTTRGASGTTILNATTSIPACLSAPFHMLGRACGKAHIDNEGATTATMLELFFICCPAPAQCPLHLWWHTIEVWDLALLRRWLDISNKMANARTQGFTVTSDIFQVELISNNHPYWCWVSSLSTGTVVYSSCMDTTQPQLTPPLPKKLRPTRKKWVTIAYPPTAALVFTVCGTGATLCPGSSLNSTDDKFQKSRRNVAFQVAHVAYNYMGHWWLALRRAETTVVCHLLIVINQ